MSRCPHKLTNACSQCGDVRGTEVKQALDLLSLPVCNLSEPHGHSMGDDRKPSSELVPFIFIFIFNYMPMYVTM